MIEIGTMQGRLLPSSDGRIQAFPADSWRMEFSAARTAGLACIEWVYELPNESRNPIGDDDGLAEIRRLSEASGVGVRSICADYYMESRLVYEGTPVSENVEHLKWLLGRAAKMGVLYVVLPFVDQSSLHGDADIGALCQVLDDVLPGAENLKVEIHLETNLTPRIFSSLLQRVDNEYLRANFDIGNSAALGHAPLEELELLGPWLGSVHVKDRILGGGTVSLGTGAADFDTCFHTIVDNGFDRFFILQAAREKEIGEIELAIKNRTFVERHLGYRIT